MASSRLPSVRAFSPWRNSSTACGALSAGTSPRHRICSGRAHGVRVCMRGVLHGIRICAACTTGYCAMAEAGMLCVGSLLGS